MKKLVICAAVLLMATLVARAATLVENGQARAVIVTPAEPDPNEQKAAEELAHYLGKMSGAQIAVVKAAEAVDGKTTRILLGKAAEAAIPDLGVDRALKNYKDNLSSKEGFVLRVTNDTVALAGPSSAGTLNAAYELLERLGVRWYFPGELGENVPQKKTVTIDACDDVQIPSFDHRTMWFSGNGGQDDKQAIALWMVRLRKGGFEWGASHNMDGVNAPTDEFVQILADRVTSDLDKSPNAANYSFGWHDGYAQVTPELAMGVQHPWHKIPQASDPLMIFYDKVIKIVEQKHPNVRFGFLCYMNYLPAPFAVQANSKLQPVIAPIEQCPRHAPGKGECWQRDALLEAVRSWSKMTGKALIYDYEPGFLIDNDFPVPCVSRMRIEYPLWHQAGLRGLFCQAQMSVGNNGPNLYVRMKLGWDVNADVDALLKDYFDGLYGPAGKPALTYWMALEEMMAHGPGHAHEDEIIKAIYPLEKVRALETYIKQAEELADNEVTKARVKALRFAHDNMVTALEARRADDEGRFADAARLARRSHELRQEIEAFNTNFVSLGDLDRTDETHRHQILGYADQNDERASRAGGAMGNLIALLPDEWSFRIDPGNEGLSYHWFDPAAWKKGDSGTISTTRIWEVQEVNGMRMEDEVGHGYDGIGWYATTVDVPKEFAGKTVQLDFGGVFGQMLIWVNGEFVKYVPYKIPWWQNPMNPVFDVDVTKAIKPGQKNTIVIRLDNEFEWGGIFRRTFLWSPTQ